MLTQTAKYAIRALIYLSEQKDGVYSQTRELAQTIQVPPNYLGKTLQKLAHARILDSQKGLHGGFRISRPAAQITLHEILIAIEAIPRDLCQSPMQDDIGLPSVVYAKFAELSGVYNDFLRSATLADMIPADAAPVAEPAAAREAIA